MDTNAAIATQAVTAMMREAVAADATRGCRHGGDELPLDVGEVAARSPPVSIRSRAPLDQVRQEAPHLPSRTYSSFIVLCLPQGLPPRSPPEDKETKTSIFFLEEKLSGLLCHPAADS